MRNFKIVCILLILCQLLERTECYYLLKHHPKKRYYWMYFSNMREGMKLYFRLSRNRFFRKNPLIKLLMRLILLSYIYHRGRIVFYGIRMFYHQELAPHANFGSYGRRLEEVDPEKEKDAKLIAKAMTTMSEDETSFFEPNVETVQPILCIGTEVGNVPGKLIDFTHAIYVQNGEVKDCDNYTVVPEERLVYTHEKMDPLCAPRGYNTETKQRTWNAVYFGKDGNYLGEANLDKTSITYVQGDEVLSSNDSFAVIC